MSNACQNSFSNPIGQIKASRVKGGVYKFIPRWILLLGQTFGSTLFLLTLLATFPLQAVAQESSSTDPDEFSIKAGYILPSRISGMDQVMPTWGLRYGYPVSFAVVEFEGVTSHAYGSDYFNLAGGLRGNSPIFPGGNFIYFAGLDETVYRPSTKSQYLNHLGFHFGGGIMMRIVNSLSFRADARFINAPGSVLAIEVGLTYRAF